MSSVLNRTTGVYLKRVHTPDYPVEDWVINPDLSTVSGIPTKHWFIDTGDVLREMTTAEKATAYLASNKDERKSQIDARTSSLIAEGFTHASKQFSLALTAQANWLAVLTAGAASGLSYPHPVCAIDNTYHDAADEAEMITMATAGMTAKASALVTGGDLKKQIDDAADQAAVDAIVDSR